MGKQDQQKEQIVDVFQKHFNHHGFKKTSVDEIAQELKMSKKTIYKHFSSKEKIFYFVISRVAKKFSSNMEKKLVDYSTQKEKVEQLIAMIFTETRKWLKQGNDAFEFKYKYEIAQLAFTDAYNVVFNKLLQTGIDSGELKISNVEITVRFINGIISESMKLISTNPDLDVEGDVISSVGKLISD